jgi:site-specific DNA-methyltransferase (adenine-specific)
MIEKNSIEVQNERGEIHPLLPTVPCNVVYHEDCIEGLKRFPDKYFDLAVVDPPYGIGEADGRCRTRKKHNNRVKHTKKDWDTKRPSAEYWAELMRVSKNQIVWGANYFTQYLPPSMGWIFWDKQIGGDFSDGELAYTSFDRALKMVTKWSGNNGVARIHPTQKPVGLYDWIFNRYSTEGNLILDTHLGSGSSRIAAHKAGLSFVGFEIDADYYAAQEKRFKTFTSQLRLF